MEKTQVIAVLAALAQDTRLDIMRMLIRQGLKGLPAGVIGKRLNLPPATLSFHLNALRHAGLISSRRKGRSVVYTGDFSIMNSAMAYLLDNCCRGDVAEAAAPPRALRTPRKSAA